MSEPEPKKHPPSIILFKLCGTCFVLFVAAGILWFITKGSDIGSDVGNGALMLLTATGVTLLMGIIAAIWEA